MKKEKEDLITVKIRRSDYKRIKRWAVTREMKFYEVINQLVSN